jgi:hypothetical protein
MSEWKGGYDAAVRLLVQELTSLDDFSAILAIIVTRFICHLLHGQSHLLLLSFG